MATTPRCRPRRSARCGTSPTLHKLNAALAEFLDMRDAMLATARASGCVQEGLALAGPECFGAVVDMIARDTAMVGGGSQ